MKKKQQIKRLKNENERIYSFLTELIKSPQSFRSSLIRSHYKHLFDIENAIWSGSPAYGCEQDSFYINESSKVDTEVFNKLKSKR